MIELGQVENGAAKKSGFTHDNKDNASVDWYTPPWIFERLGLRFDLDPCQPETPIPWIPAARTYSLKDDGLKSPWHGLLVSLAANDNTPTTGDLFGGVQ